MLCRDVNGENFPYRVFGYITFLEFLHQEAGDLWQVSSDDYGTAMILPLSSSNTEHLERLIGRQKRTRTTAGRIGGVVQENMAQGNRRNIRGGRFGGTGGGRGSAAAPRRVIENLPALSSILSLIL